MDRPTVVVALLTPFDERGRPDAAALRGHVEWLVEAGVDAVMPAGTTGEGPLLDDDEVVACVAAATAGAGERIQVLAHVGRASTVATIRLARKALDAGANGVSAVVPYYYELDEGQIVEHYRALLAAVSAPPVFAYTIPTRSGNDLPATALAKLVDEGLAGVKDSTKSMERHREFLEVARDRPLRVLMGSDGLVLEALRAGASGAVSAVGNVRPDLLVRLARAVANGSDAEGEAAQRELSNLREEVSRSGALGGLKLATARALARRGVPYPVTLRRPLG